MIHARTHENALGQSRPAVALGRAERTPNFAPHSLAAHTTPVVSAVRQRLRPAPQLRIVALFHEA